MNMKRTIVIAACFLLIPMAILAAPNDPAKKTPSQAAIDACAGKAVGDAVKLPLKNGQMVSAKCKEVNGQLVAVRKRRHHKRKSTDQPTPPVTTFP